MHDKDIFNNVPARTYYRRAFPVTSNRFKLFSLLAAFQKRICYKLINVILKGQMNSLSAN